MGARNDPFLKRYRERVRGGMSEKQADRLLTKEVKEQMGIDYSKSRAPSERRKRKNDFWDFSI